MSAEILREAAAAMREEHGPEHPRHQMWEAIAVLLDERAAVWLDEAPVSQDHRAVAVATTYLEAPR